MNIEAHPLKLFPPNGVYATKTLYEGKYYYGVTNIGKNPTVNGTQKIVETYLFDFNKMIYGEELQIFFYKFLRSEQTRAYFASAEYEHWKAEEEK